MKKVLILIFFLSLICILSPNTVVSQEMEGAGNSYTFVTEQKASEDKFLSYLNALAGPIVALIGIILTLPILRKRLIETHISTALSEIQKVNSEIQKKNQQLLDNLLALRDKAFRVPKEDLEQVYERIKEIYLISLDGSSDVATFMFYLKITLQNSIRNYDANPDFMSYSFYDWIIDVLEKINFYSTQAIQIPQSSKMEKKAMVKKSLHPFVTHSHIIKYKHFPRGVIEDPNALHYLQFIEEVNLSRIELLMRSAFQIHWAPNTVMKLLYINNIYAPPVIIGGKSFLGQEGIRLYLVGYVVSEEIKKTGSEMMVKIYYSSPSDKFSTFEDGAGSNPLVSYKDDWINSSFALSEYKTISKSGFETIELKFDKAYLEKFFSNYKKEIKKKLKAGIRN